MSLRIGVVGTGQMGRYHVERLASGVPDAQGVAVSDVYVEGAKQGAGQGGGGAYGGGPGGVVGGAHRLPASHPRGVPPAWRAGEKAGAVREAAGPDDRRLPAGAGGR